MEGIFFNPNSVDELELPCDQKITSLQQAVEELALEAEEVRVKQLLKIILVVEIILMLLFLLRGYFCVKFSFLLKMFSPASFIFLLQLRTKNMALKDRMAAKLDALLNEVRGASSLVPWMLGIFSFYAIFQVILILALVDSLCVNISMICYLLLPNQTFLYM